jgi:hypothetical protein
MMRIPSRHWLIAVCLLALLAAYQPASAAAPGQTPNFPAQGTVNSNANLRSGPGTSYAKVGSAKAGDAVQVKGCNDGCTWYQLQNGQWIFAELVDLRAAEAAAPRTPAPAAASPAAPAAKPAVIFANPAKVCNALAAEGLAPMGSGWSDEDLGYFNCFSDDLEVTTGSYTAVSDVPNTVYYGAESDSADRVQTITLNADLFNTAKAEPAVKQFGAIAVTLFKRLGLALPSGLPAAITASKSVSYTMPYGVVTLTREAYNLGYGSKLTIEDVVYLQDKAKAVAGAGDVVTQCQEIIGGLRGYPAADVVGDGEPTAIDGGQSFLFEGRGGDIFFCEVMDNGAYTISAALGGEFPFKDIDSGTLR